ncbi:hypothetical protein FQR65_LT20368 [Abscondita terminalis]|nr:hypothetical protein FQR65_LT20368 [Abscondita terminalis]
MSRPARSGGRHEQTRSNRPGRRKPIHREWHVGPPPGSARHVWEDVASRVLAALTAQRLDSSKNHAPAPAPGPCSTKAWRLQFRLAMLHVRTSLIAIERTWPTLMPAWPWQQVLPQPGGRITAHRADTFAKRWNRLASGRAVRIFFVDVFFQLSRRPMSAKSAVPFPAAAAPGLALIGSSLASPQAWEPWRIGNCVHEALRRRQRFMSSALDIRDAPRGASLGLGPVANGRACSGCRRGEAEARAGLERRPTHPLAAVVAKASARAHNRAFWMRLSSSASSRSFSEHAARRPQLIMRPHLHRSFRFTSAKAHTERLRGLDSTVDEFMRIELGFWSQAISYQLPWCTALYSGATNTGFAAGITRRSPLRAVPATAAPPPIRAGHRAGTRYRRRSWDVSSTLCERRTASDEPVRQNLWAAPRIGGILGRYGPIGITRAQSLRSTRHPSNACTSESARPSRTSAARRTQCRKFPPLFRVLFELAQRLIDQTGGMAVGCVSRTRIGAGRRRGTAPDRSHTCHGSNGRASRMRGHGDDVAEKQANVTDAPKCRPVAVARRSSSRSRVWGNLYVTDQVVNARGIEHQSSPARPDAAPSRAWSGDLIVVCGSAGGSGRSFCFLVQTETLRYSACPWTRKRFSAPVAVEHDAGLPDRVWGYMGMAITNASSLGCINRSAADNAIGGGAGWAWRRIQGHRPSGCTLETGHSI